MPKIEVGSLVELNNGSRLHVLQIDVNPEYPEESRYVLGLCTAEQWQQERSTNSGPPDDSEHTFSATFDQLTLVPPKASARQKPFRTDAESVDVVRCWLETTSHHLATTEPGKWNPRQSKNPEDPGYNTGKYFILQGHTHLLRVPRELWVQCYTKPAGELDARMYRWDYDAEWAALRPLVKRAKSSS